MRGFFVLGHLMLSLCISFITGYDAGYRIESVPKLTGYASS